MLRVQGDRALQRAIFIFLIAYMTEHILSTYTVSAQKIKASTETCIGGILVIGTDSITLPLAQDDGPFEITANGIVLTILPAATDSNNITMGLPSGPLCGLSLYTTF